MDTEIITKVGVINSEGYNFILGDGNPKILRGASDNKATISYPKSGLWRVFLVEEKKKNKKILTKIVLEHNQAKIEGSKPKLTAKNLNIISNAFSVTNADYCDAVAHYVGKSNIGVKTKYTKKISAYAAFEKYNENKVFTYEDKYLIVNDIENFAYNLSTIYDDDQSYLLSIVLERIF